MAITNSTPIQYNEHISYAFFDDGYDIYLDGEPWISQRAPYNRVYKPNGTDEENCMIQLEELTAVPEEPVDAEGKEVE